jgi:hypothetical protein
VVLAELDDSQLPDEVYIVKNLGNSSIKDDSQDSSILPSSLNDSMREDLEFMLNHSQAIFDELPTANDSEEIVASTPIKKVKFLLKFHL